MAETNDEAARRRLRTTNAKLPAGLGDEGRDEDLVSSKYAHPSGARGDNRHSVPGTLIPGGARPAAEQGEWPADRSSD